MADMNLARDGACHASDGENIYAIGGYDGHDYTLSTEAFSPETGVWENKCKLYSRRISTWRKNSREAKKALVNK